MYRQLGEGFPRLRSRAQWVSMKLWIEVLHRILYRSFAGRAPLAISKRS
jgi:hypothetical protein